MWKCCKAAQNESWDYYIKAFENEAFGKFLKCRRTFHSSLQGSICTFITTATSYDNWVTKRARAQAALRCAGRALDLSARALVAVSRWWDFSMSIKVLALTCALRFVSRCCSNERQAAEETLAAPVIFLLVLVTMTTTMCLSSHIDNVQHACKDMQGYVGWPNVMIWLSKERNCSRFNCATHCVKMNFYPEKKETAISSIAQETTYPQSLRTCFR